MCSSPATRRSSSVARPSAMVVVWNVAWHFSECAATQNRLTVAPRGSQRRTLLHLANGSAMSVAGFALLARAVRMSSYTTRWFTAATTRIAVKLLYLYILTWTGGVLYPRSVQPRSMKQTEHGSEPGPQGISYPLLRENMLHAILYTCAVEDVTKRWWLHVMAK